MNINYKEPQFELFPANSASLEDINKPKFLLATLTLSTESLVILVILGIMIALFSFSLGVERGKHLAAQSLDEKVTAAWNVGRKQVNHIPAATVSSSVVINQALLNKPALVGSHQKTNQTSVTTTPKTVVQKINSTTTNQVATTGKWTVQLSTYKNEKYAQQEAKVLKSKGYPVYIVKSKEYYLVCVGQFSSQEQAAAFLKRNPTKGQGSQVRPLKHI